MDIPFIFYGSPDDTLVIIADKVVEWNQRDANYYFQMWRDIPSHVIYYRDLLSTDFLPGFDLDPIAPPPSRLFRYDYLANGNVPAGYWLKFNMGIEPSPHVGSISFQYYNPAANNLSTKRMLEGSIELEAENYLLLLTNVASSSQDGKEVFDHRARNVLVRDDDGLRRAFNERFFEAYLDYVTTQILDDKEFVTRFLRLSGITIIEYLSNKDPDVEDQVKQYLDQSGSELPPHLAYLLAKNLGLETKRPADHSDMIEV